MASTYRYHDMGTPTLRTKFTWSIWCKRSELGGYMTLASMWKDSNDHVVLRFDNTDQLRFYYSESSGGSQDLKTNAVYRDTAAWYHIVATFDSTQSTSSDRAKLYVNGEQITSFATETYPSQNEEPDANVSGTDHYLGARGDGHNYGGLMSHCHFVDGAVYAASTFGSTDSSTGEWKINTDPTISEYGTNGWFMFKDDASLTDRSGKSNDFTNQSGTLTQTEDCPSNVFCTGNPLARYANNLTYSQGNLTMTSSSGWWMGSTTLGASSGKYYWEYKMTTLGSGSGYHKMGFISNQAFDITAGHPAVSGLDGGYAVYNSGGEMEVRTDDGVISGYDKSSLGNISFSVNDIMCIAIDMDNKKAYFRKNGDAWIKSADPANGTNGLDISSDYPSGSTKCMIPAFGIYESGVGSANFGNGYFGTTAISSEGTNASGIGKFEYDVPTGYTALSTKGLNE